MRSVFRAGVSNRHNVRGAAHDIRGNAHLDIDVVARPSGVGRAAGVGVAFMISHGDAGRYGPLGEHDQRRARSIGERSGGEA